MDGNELIDQLQGQLDWHWRTQARPRLDGLSDAELIWEPAAGTWNVRRADAAAPATATYRAGTGPWRIDWAFPAPDPAPVTSIAWRLGHLVVGVFGARNHAHFGGPVCDYDTWPYAGTAAEALRQLDGAHQRWSDGVRSLTPERLWSPVGEAEGAWADHPMIELVLHINREAIHHLAEIALLRDLYRAR